MSASLALAGVSACTKQPAEKIIPYVRQPENMVPGRPLFFATAIPFGGVAAPVLVESHEGHPTKVEGNPQHPASLGATDSFAQAAILDLYDPDRAKTVLYRGEVRGWGDFLTALQNALGDQKAKQGAGLRFLTETLTSPTVAEQMSLIQQAYPQAKWHQWDPVPRDAARAAARQGAGQASDAIYHFDKADVIVTLDADFLTCGASSVRYSRDFANRRRQGVDGDHAVDPHGDGRREADEPALRDREHADAHGREGGSSPGAARLGDRGGRAGALLRIVAGVLLERERAEVHRRGREGPAGAPRPLARRRRRVPARRRCTTSRTR